jgi:hypothetical protein
LFFTTYPNYYYLYRERMEIFNNWIGTHIFSIYKLFHAVVNHFLWQSIWFQLIRLNDL